MKLPMNNKSYIYYLINEYKDDLYTGCSLQSDSKLMIFISSMQKYLYKTTSKNNFFLYATAAQNFSQMFFGASSSQTIASISLLSVSISISSRLRNKGPL